MRTYCAPTGLCQRLKCRCTYSIDVHRYRRLREGKVERVGGLLSFFWVTELAESLHGRKWKNYGLINVETVRKFQWSFQQDDRRSLRKMIRDFVPRCGRLWSIWGTWGKLELYLNICVFTEWRNRAYQVVSDQENHLKGPFMWPLFISCSKSPKPFRDLAFNSSSTSLSLITSNVLCLAASWQFFISSNRSCLIVAEQSSHGGHELYLSKLLARAIPCPLWPRNESPLWGYKKILLRDSGSEIGTLGLRRAGNPSGRTPD